MPVLFNELKNYESFSEMVDDFILNEINRLSTPNFSGDGITRDQIMSGQIPNSNIIESIDNPLNPGEKLSNITTDEYKRILKREAELEEIARVEEGDGKLRKELEARQFEGLGEVWSYHDVSFSEIEMLL